MIVKRLQAKIINLGVKFDCFCKYAEILIFNPLARFCVCCLPAYDYQQSLHYNASRMLQVSLYLSTNAQHTTTNAHQSVLGCHSRPCDSGISGRAALAASALQHPVRTGALDVLCTQRPASITYHRHRGASLSRSVTTDFSILIFPAFLKLASRGLGTKYCVALHCIKHHISPILSRSPLGMDLHQIW